MAETVNKDNTDTFRSTLAQVVASLALCAIGLNVGLILAMPPIVIPALKNESSAIQMTDEQASWFGSILYIFQPIGSLISGGLQGRLGRKACLILVNVPQLIAMALIYFSTSVAHLFSAMILVGLSLGFMEAPILCYVGEITQPRLRGILTSFCTMCFSIGVMLESALGAALPWRSMILWSMLGPVLGFICMCLVPDSPAWLVSKGRVREGQRALKWLRGWVEAEDVKHELQDLVSYVKETQGIKMDQGEQYVAVSNSPDSEVAPQSKAWWQILTEPIVLMAFRIIFLYIFIGVTVSLVGVKAFLIELLVQLKSPVDPYQVLTFTGFVQLLGSVIMGPVMRTVGKRRLTFFTLATCTFCCLAMGIYLLLEMHSPWVPLILINLAVFSSFLGVYVIPWILIMELFPLRARGLGGAICAAVGYVSMFLAIKTYYDIVAWVNVSGVFLLNSVVGLLGFVYLYFDLPETEGMNLEAIERKLNERLASKHGNSINTDNNVSKKRTISEEC